MFVKDRLSMQGRVAARADVHCGEQLGRGSKLSFIFMFTVFYSKHYDLAPAPL